MPRVICDLPNASDEISGIKFHPLDDGGMISDEISQEQAARFASITGYAIDDGSVPAPVAVEAKPAPVARKTGGKKTAEPVAPEPVVEPVAQPEAGEGEEVF